MLFTYEKRYENGEQQKRFHKSDVLRFRWYIVVLSTSFIICLKLSQFIIKLFKLMLAVISSVKSNGR